MQEYARHIAGWKLSTFWGVSTRENICLYPCEIVPNEWSLEECLQEGKLVKNLEIFWMNNKRIIEFGFCTMWKSMQISEDVIHLGLQPRWITSSLICIILHILLSLIGPVVWKVDKSIHWIKVCPVDNAISFPNTYAMDSDLSSRQDYPTFQQLGPVVLRIEEEAMLLSVFYYCICSFLCC